MFRAAILVILTSTPVLAQSLTPTEVEAAVAAGSAGASPRLSCIARGAAGGLFSGSFTVNIEGPMGHVMRMAAEAKRKYKPFTVADVSEEMLAPVLRLVVEPDPPTRRGRTLVTTPVAVHVVIKGVKSRDAIQPLAQVLAPVSWSNQLGGKVEGQAVVASFPLDSFRAIPEGDVEVVIVTEGGERRCTLPVKQRATFR